MKEIITILFSYLKRPQLYPELGRKIIKNLFQRNAALKGQGEMEAWCESKALGLAQTLTKLDIESKKALADLFPNEFAWAQQKAASSPVSMGGAGALELLYYLSEKIQAKVVVETGVAYGWSSWGFLLSLKNRNGKLYSSDMPYMSKNNDAFVGIVVPDEWKKHWNLYRFADRESLPKIFKEISEIDLCHYDSDKTYQGRMWAYPKLWEKLRVGGYFLSDDIGDNIAFKDWVEEMKLSPIILKFEGKYIGIIEKK